MTQRTCDVDGCGKPHEAHGLCRTHYSRWRRNGDLEYRQKTVVGLVCSVQGCGRDVLARNLCRAHYQGWYKYGNPLGLGRASGDQVGYSAVHERLNRSRGPASRYLCVECGSPAHDWAYDHSDPSVKIDRRLDRWYSTDVGHYQPMCKKCHRRFDLKQPSPK